MRQAKWHILGPGAIGSLWACGFSQAGQPVSLIIPQHHPLKQHALRFTQHGESQDFAVPRQYARSPLPAPAEAIDNLLVCLKAFQVVPAIKQLLPRLHAGSCIVLLHNGLGTLEPLKAILPAQATVLCGTTTHGAYCPTPYSVIHAGIGETRIGPGLGQCSVERRQQVVRDLDQALPPTQWQDDIERALWLKMAINCAINPLTALEECRNGELMRTDRLGAVQAVCDECAKLLSYKFTDSPTEPAELFSLVRAVIEQTAENYSSMNRDLAAGKPSEIEFITGFALRQGEQAGVAMPANQALYQAIKLRES